MALVVNKIPGQKPKGWGRSCIFFANILSLFYGNETETDVLRQEVGALETYGSRLIPLLNLLYEGEDNLLVLEREPEGELLNYFKEDLNLQLPQIKVVSHKTYRAIVEDKGSKDVKELMADLSAHPAQCIDGYVTDEVLVEVSRKTSKETTSTNEGSRNGNNKLLLNEYIESEDLPRFDTYNAASSQEIKEAISKLKDKGYTMAVVKAQIGASGIGMKKVSVDDTGADYPEYLFFEGPCLVQGWLDDSVEGVRYLGSPSVQMFLKDDSVDLHDMTEQILSADSVHEGNISPPPHLEGDKKTGEELLKQAELAARWLHAQNYRGTASTDFHLIERSGEKEVRICEINARVTGATYPAMLARHFLAQGAWLMRNIRFSPPTETKKILEVLQKEDILYYPKKPAGVLPFNFNPNAQGEIVKGQFLFLGQSIPEVQQLLKQVKELDTFQGDFDRD